MNTRAFVAIGLLAGSGALLSQPARALVPIPIGTPDGLATDLLTINGTYAPPLPVPPAQPFAAPAFTLSMTIPAQVTVSAAGPVLSEFYLPVSGSYTNDGQTETFSTAFAAGTTPSGCSLRIRSKKSPPFTTNSTPPGFRVTCLIPFCAGDGWECRCGSG